MSSSPSRPAVCARCGGPGTENLTPNGTLVCNQCIHLVLAEPVKFEEAPLSRRERNTALVGAVVGAMLLVAGVAGAMSFAMAGARRLELRLAATIPALGLVLLVYSIRKLRGR
jgi:hypothetical protein